VSTYLIDQADGQVAYGSYRVAASNSTQTGTGHGTLSRPPKSVNFDMGEDNYIDTLRRNAYSQGIKAKTIEGGVGWKTIDASWYIYVTWFYF